MRRLNAKVTDAALIGGITLDEETQRLVKTYSKGLEVEPHRVYFELDAPIQKH